MNKKRAFTLVEVLVTLGIIGIVAAMTMPNLMINHKKRVVETRLKNFYSIMNQAVKTWEKDQGLLPEDASKIIGAIQNSTDYGNWFRNSIGAELNILSQEKLDNTNYKVILADGSSFIGSVQSTTGRPMQIHYCVDAKLCANTTNADAKNVFHFAISNGKFLTCWTESWRSETREQIFNRCKNPSGNRHACTRLIEIDGWQIKDDYPW